MKNPDRALAAFTASGTPVGKWVVREITLGLAGVLERISSPLITGILPPHIDGWRKTLFAMTHSTEESESLLSKPADAYTTAARDWADTVPLREANQMIRACTAAAKRVQDVSPSGDDAGEESDAEKNALEGTATGG